MKSIKFVSLVVLLTAVTLVAATQAPPVWQQVAQPAFDPAKTARVENLVLVRDRIRITLQQGVIQFGQPVEGVVFAAAFRGTGRIEVAPPNPIEAQQLKLFTGKTEMAMPFTEAVFSFTDGTLEEFAGQVQWGSAPPDPALQRTYQSRMDYRESYGAEILPRLVQGILSSNKKQTELFLAEVKTDEKDWIIAGVDALDPEEVVVGRWVTYNVFRFVDVWMQFPRGNRTSAEAWKDPIAREDMLPLNYKIEADVTRSEVLSVRALAEVKPRWDGERLINFYFDSNLRVTSVKDTATGAALPFAQPEERKERVQSYGDYLTVFFPEPLSASKTYALEFVYSGRRVVRNVGPGAFFCQSFGWYPARRNFALRSNFELSFRSPKRFGLAATGAKTSEAEEGDAVLTTWKSEKPMAVAGFAFGEVKIATASAGKTEIEVFANKEPDNTMKEILRIVEGGGQPSAGIGTGGARATTSGEREMTGFALGGLKPAAMADHIAQETANSLRLFENYFGPYPYTRLSVSTIPYSYGQGWPSLLFLSALTFLDSGQRNQLGIRGRDAVMISDFFRAHEVSHQWWGHKVAWKSYHDQWLSEGFAEFSGNLYVQLSRGPAGSAELIDRLQIARKRMQEVDDKRHVRESVGPIWMGRRLNSSESPGAYSQLVYEKGGFVLHMLRMMLFDSRDPSGDGDRRFKTMMRDFTQVFDNKAASTEDFKAIAEKHMIDDMNLDGNGRLDWFFNQYVYGTGLPTYDFKYSVTDAGGGQWKFTGTLTQSGVPEGWKDVLPLYVEVNRNIIRVGNVNVMQRVTTWEMMLPMKPTRFILCRNEDNIGTIKQ
jgi:hypothetical protein